MAKRRRTISGFIPRVARALWGSARWCLRHPQPLVALAAAAACGLGLWGFALRSEAFRITEIQVPTNSPLSLPESLVGENLWTVDLKALAQALKAQQPQLKRVRVIRVLPQTLQIEVLERNPVAQVRLSQWHAVDAEGFIFPQGSPRPSEHLVMLKGVERPHEPLKAGRENSSEHLLLALRLLGLLRRSPALIGHGVTTVDVADPKQLSFVVHPAPSFLASEGRGGVDDEIEVRCGSEEELRAHLDRLRGVLRTIARQQLSVRYIDLRFEDPVIGPRTSRTREGSRRLEKA